MASLNIKNDELVKKIRVVADRKRLGITATLNELVDRELSNQGTIGGDDELIKYWLNIGRRNRERDTSAISSDRIDDFLYDEMGLPK